MSSDRGTPRAIVLPLECRARGCDSRYVQLLIRSSTVVTLQCLKCQFMWSDELSAMPDDIRRQITQGAGMRP